MPRGGSISDRVEKIFKALESGKPLTLTSLAKHAKMHYWTAQQYVDLILEIQNRPRLEKIEAESKVVLVRVTEN